jgi:esterase/lipase superfamily enzyme
MDSKGRGRACTRFCPWRCDLFSARRTADSWRAVAGASAALVLLALAGCARVPKRSEYPRRLHPAKSAAAHRFDFYFASQRFVDPGGWLEEGNRYTEERTAGIYRARIEPELHIGERSMVASWQETKELEITSVDEIEPHEWWSRLESEVRSSPHDSLLVLVWGWKEHFESAALKTAYVSYILDIDTPVLLFDWPSNQGNDPGGYLRARSLTEPCGRDLGKLLTEIDSRIAPRKLWVLTSSLGCQTVCQAFDWMISQESLADSQPEFDHVVFCAPDVADDEFDGRFKAEIASLSRYITVYVNSVDRALLLSSWINQAKRLGRRPPEAPPQFEEMMDLLELGAGDSGRITLVDVTPISRTRNYHHYFTDSPEFFDDLYIRLLDDPPHVSRRLYRVRYDGDVEYWILWEYEDE